MLNKGLFIAQRLTAIIMAPLVIGHLIGIIYAIQGGLDAAEILSRTHGSVLFGIFYQLFVLAVSIHAAIGIRVILYEWANLRGRWLELVTWLTGLMLLFTGSFAVFALVLAQA